MKFSAGRISNHESDPWMHLRIWANNDLVHDSDAAQRVDLEFNMTLPGRIQIDVSGKRSGLDTLVDEQGVILRDKFVRLDWISIDRLPVKHWIVQSKLIQFHSDEMPGTHHTNYFGFNGSGVLDLCWPNSLALHLGLTEQIDQ